MRIHCGAWRELSRTYKVVQVLHAAFEFGHCIIGRTRSVIHPFWCYATTEQLCGNYLKLHEIYEQSSIRSRFCETAN